MAKACVLETLVVAAATNAALGQVSEEQMARAVNTGVSIMLLGSIGFMMGLFYLVNQHDHDMRKYSWMVISSTISIFSSVLLFQAVNGVVEAYILGEHPSEEFELWVSMTHFLAWFLFLQAILGFLAGPGRGDDTDLSEEELMYTETNLKCGGILLGHLTGFAAINAFAVLQLQLPRSFPVVLCAFPIAWTSIFLLSRVTQTIRSKIAMQDGKKDEREEKWDEEAAETENDVVGLAASFMVVQSLRFGISGTLPNPEGEEPEDIISTHSDFQAWLLLCVGFMFVVGNVVQIMKYPFKNTRWLSARLLPQLKNIVAMDYAWCVFFSSEWFIASHLFTTTHGMMQEITLALFVTLVAFALIFIIREVERLESTGHRADSACRAVIQSISVLIGFSWEKAFDAAVADFTAAIWFSPQAITKLVLAVLLVLLVTPAWRLHILPYVLLFNKEDEENEEEPEGAEAEEAPREEAPRDLSELSPSADGSLGTPLLKSPASPRKAKDLARSKSFVGLSTPAIERKCMAYKAQVKQLQKQLAMAQSENKKIVPNEALHRRNRELEAALACIENDMCEVEKLAAILNS